MSLSVYENTVYRLVAANIPSPRLEARLLIGYLLQTDPDKISVSTILNKEEITKLDMLITRRISDHKPLDKILGYKDFYKYRFKVTEDVLSPRPDTEILVEAALDYIHQNHPKTILDLGTGSGCIICSILADCPDLIGCAVDKSPQALNIAQENATSLGIKQRCSWICADWFSSDFLQKIPQQYDLIVSNPPYIPSQTIQTLDVEVRKYDPLSALDGGQSGLDSYRQIARHCRHLLTDNGYIFLEAGIDQADSIIKIFEQQTLSTIKTLPDLSGIERCLIFQKA